MTTDTLSAPVTVVRIAHTDGWLDVCDLDRLSPGRGAAVLLPDGGQAALFMDRSGRVHAIGNRDPFTGAYVLSRGLLGSADGRPFVASPLLKQRFDLATGVCLDDEEAAVPVYAVRVERRPGPPSSTLRSPRIDDPSTPCSYSPDARPAGPSGAAGPHSSVE